MSKSSTATLPKIPTQLPQKSAWSKGPPQSTTVPSPRSQSPAPPSPSNAPHLTHSRRPSTLGQGVPIKEGVSIPRNNVGAVKQGSAVTFGSIDDVSAPISSSPAATPAIKSEGVKSFGSVPATTSSVGHVNGKASISKPATASTSASASTSSTPPPSTPTATPAKPKVDVRMFFRTPTAPAPADPPSSSPSTRPTSLPQQPPPPQNSSQPAQLGANPYTPFVPQNNGIRAPAQQNSATGGSGAPRSPVYPRQPMTNGNGPRPPNGPNGPGGPSQMSSGMGSPRMSQHPGQPGMSAPMPPQMPSQMQSQMPQMWPGHFYYPGMPPDQQPYMSYQGWYGMPPPPPQHPGMPPQHQPQPMQHHAPPPAPQPHQGMPMSPRNLPMPIHSGPGTPTPAHAVPATHHVPPPLTQHHSSSSSVGGVSTPPPTPSTARLNTNASAFVPSSSSRPKSKIVLKSAEGVEIKLENLKQQSQSPAPPASSATSTATSSPAPAVGGSPGHSSRKSVQIRMESEEARKKRIAEEEEKEKEKARAKAEAEEKERKAKEEEEKERLRKEEEEKERVRKEEEEKKQKEEEEKERIRLEEKKRKEEEEARIKAEAEEKERKEKEEKERLRKEEEEKERLKKAEEEARLKEQEEAAVAAAAAAAASSTITEEPASISEEEGEVQEISAKPKEEDDDNLATPGQEKSKDAPLRIDTASSAPVEFPRRRPGPLDLSTTFKPNIPAALPSALATARIIDDLSRVPYPENIQSPKVELNINAKDGKFRYDREFLLQFMSICKEKPDMLPPLDAIGIGPVDQHTMVRTNSRGGTHRPGRTPSMSGPSGGSNAAGFPGFGPKAIPSGGMGNFVSGKQLSSQERFELASGGRAVSVSSIGSFNRMPPMTRSASQGGSGSQLGGSKRTRSKRGEARDKNQGSQLAQGSSARDNQSIFENPPPLQVTANRWDRKTVGAVDPDSPELVDRKVKALLNKLTMEKFDSISDQIIEWANKSEKEKDGRTLIQVIRLVFEKATDEATWSEMYARLCRKMMEQISPKVQDDGIKNAEGKPIAGGQLFRKYLLNRCQEDFERGWVAKETTAAAAATKAMEDKAAAAANEKGAAAAAAGEQADEIVLYSDEYYAAQKAKRQGLGLIKFIGELFKLQMLTERIMHECVKKLLGNVENPEEEEIESLCKLISTVGSLLDTPKARAHMDVYFSRMKELCKSSNVGSRMQFMLQDVIELRDRKWVARTQIAAPTTIAGVHEAAAKEKAIQEKESYQRTMSMSRGGSRRGGDRGEFPGPGADGWTNVASSNTPRPPPKAGDLSNFGKIASSKGLPMTFGPSSVFAGKKDSSKRESLSRVNSNSNMFSMLSQTPDAAADPKPAPEPTRRRLILQPRTKPTEDQGTATAEATPAGSDNSESEDEEAAPEMSKEDADKKIAEDSKEFFAVRNLDEAEVYFSALPAVHHCRLIEKLVGTAVEGKEALAQLVADLLTRVVSKELCTADALEDGFAPLVEILEDIAIDAPKAPNNMALMMKAAFDGEQAARIAAKSTDPDSLVALLS